jgi:hypothetical protein
VYVSAFIILLGTLLGLLIVYLTPKSDRDLKRRR